MRKLASFLLPMSVIALGLTGLSTAQAQGADDEIEEIIVSGLRGKPRSSIDSAVPVDVFSTESIDAVAHADTVDILQTLVASYNVSRQPISDGATFIRPASLRGLPSHHTLVLVNGKRRHRAALVSIGGSGTQGPDVATIPSSAVASIEVLRDGASSQYGSDAIAGVINFNLKENTDGFSLSLDSGEYFEGDGAGYTVTGNAGFPLGENGFLSISAEVHESDFTERAHQYCEGWFCADADSERFGTQSAVRMGYVTGVPHGELYNGQDVSAFQMAYPAALHTASVEGENVMPWGQPNAESVRTFVNAGIDLGNGSELYAFSNYSTSSGDGSFFYRYPGNGTIEFVRDADGTPYFPMEKFPGGFTPRFEGEVEDFGILGGIRGQRDGGTSYDVSLRYGSNAIDYHLWNTINPSYGSDSPTDFKPGELENEEMQFQIDLISEHDIGTASPLVFAYGFSYMDETYNVHQSSDVASYAAGPHALSDPYGFCQEVEVMAEGQIEIMEEGQTEILDEFGVGTGVFEGDGIFTGTGVFEGDGIFTGTGTFTNEPTTVAGGGAWTSSVGGQAAVAGVDVAGLDCNDSSDPAFRVVGVGSNGFPGYSPAFSEEYNRDSYAVYGDISTDVTENFFVQAALRYEDYSDFGEEIVGKIAGRVRLNDEWALRGSVGTGFRAPTPGQQGTTNVSTRLPNGFPVATGLFPASGPVAQALGAVPLRAETSTSYTFGLTGGFGEGGTLTIDFYNIDIDDRFSAISTRDVSTDPTSGSAYDNYLALSAAGVVGAESIGGVLYFTNAFDSKTTGIDVVASYPFSWENGSDTTFQFAMNYNRSTLESDASAYLNAEGRHDFEHADPNTRWNLTAFHNVNEQFSLMGRVRYFGESKNANSCGADGCGGMQMFGSTTFVDLEASYRANDNWKFTVGARNIFDTYPDKIDRIAGNNDFCCGRTWVSGSIVPWQGGYYFGKVSVSF